MEQRRNLYHHVGFSCDFAALHRTGIVNAKMAQSLQGKGKSLVQW
jgi:hypothetical protein